MFRLMGARFEGLRYADWALNCHEPALVLRHTPQCADVGKTAFIALTDDAGIYVVVPRLAALLGSDLDHAMRVFVAGVTTACFVAGAIGWARLLQTGWARAACAAYLALLYVVALFFADVYFVALAVAVAAVPWAILAVRALTARTALRWSDAAAFFLIASLAWSANIFRSHSGTAILLFTGLLLLFSRATLRLKAIAFAVMAAALIVPFAAMQVIVAERDAYISRHVQIVPLDSHPFWHNVYLGIAYTSPTIKILGEPRDDTMVVAAVTKANGGKPVPYLGPEHERIARGIALDFIKTYPDRFLQNLAAKIGATALYLLIFFLPGVLLIRRVPPALGIAFGIAIAFTALPGLIGLPRPDYMTGAMAFCALLSIVAVEAWVTALGGRVRLADLLPRMPPF